MNTWRDYRAVWVFLFVGITLIATSLGIAETLAWRDSHRLAVQSDIQRLHSTLAAQTLLQNERTRELELRTGILANNAAFIAYVTQALTAGALPGTKIDTASIFDQLLQRKRQLGLNLAAVLDAQGRLVIASGRMPIFHGQPAADSLLRQVLTSQRPAVGLLQVGGYFEQVALVPLVRGDVIEALLLTGRNVDARFAQSLAEVSDTEVALIASAGPAPQILASTLSASQSRALSDALIAQPGLLARRAAVALTLGGRAARIRPLFGTTQGAKVVILAPPASTHAIWLSLSQSLLMGAASFGVLLIFGAMILQRRLLQPLQRLSKLMERAATGDYELSATAVRGGTLVAHLGNAFDRLMQHLRLRQSTAAVAAVSQMQGRS
ncbi:MAG: methyl-accepting chemotaxis protein [Gallionella sp.]|jgi:HAMP domain-containing protein